MTEDEGQAWIAANFGDGAVDRLARLAHLVTVGTEKQNLIARSTLPSIWVRHIVDSAQLLPLVSKREVSDGHWIDVGSGAGFPGLVVAVLAPRPVVLVEPRKKRAAFLSEAIADLQLPHAQVLCGQIEAVDMAAAVVSARAVAPLTSLFDLCRRCTQPQTIWALPKGRTASVEVAEARLAWHGVFHVEQSVTDPNALVVLAEKVSRR